MMKKETFFYIVILIVIFLLLYYYVKKPPFQFYKLKYFNISEFDSPDQPGSGAYMNPDFLKKLDKAREKAGIPFRINSGYRTEAHNRKVGGVNDSAHLKGLAVDISTTPETKEIIYNSLKSVGFVRFGIGGNFIHVDDDLTKPNPAVWTY